MRDYRCTMEQDRFYHVFNRGINGTTLFFNNRNYEFFIKRYEEYMPDFVDTIAWCLLPNHFHLLIRVKNVSHLLNVKHLRAGASASDAFQRLFTSYAKAINKQERRHGSLFEKPFKRISVDSTRYLENLISYIHANPQLHGICKDFRKHQWNSYNQLSKNAPTLLKTCAIEQWTDSPEPKIKLKAPEVETEEINKLIIE